MSDRNENKNYENVQLNVEQLEGVSGGFASQLCVDSVLLSHLGLCQAYDVDTLSSDKAAFQEVVNAWEKAGVKVYAYKDSSNVYKVNGKIVDIWTARKYIEDQIQ